MSYLNLDDGFLDHPKFVRADRRCPSRAIHLWLGIMQYCKRLQTDGVVPLDMLARLNGPATRYRKAALDALVAEQLIELGETELRVHDYLQWNSSRAAIEAKAATKSADRKARRDGQSERPTRSPDGRLTVVASSPARRTSDVAAVDLSSAASNDVVDIDGDGQGPSPARARDTTTTTTTNERSPSNPPQPELGLDAQTPSTAAPVARKPKASRARTLCPLDFAPDETTQAKATSLGFSAKLELETRETFIDWWRGKGNQMQDWQATYRNWLRRTAADRGLRPPPADTPQRRLWADQKRRAEAPPAQPAPGAREQIKGAMSASLGRLHAS